MVEGRKSKSTSPLKLQESPDEFEEGLKRRRTSSSQTLEFSKDLPMNPPIVRVDYPDSDQVLDVVPLSVRSPVSQSTFNSPSASPIGPHTDPIGFVALFASEIRKEHVDPSFDEPSTVNCFDFSFALNSVVEIAFSSMIQEGLVSLV